MHNISYLLVIAFLISGKVAAQDRPDWVIVIHGGAGNINRENLSAEREAEYRAALTEALNIGSAILEEGGHSGDAVEYTIRYLEDHPLFNAGKGAVFTADTTVELDASFMDGRTRSAGAVAGVTTIKHPISAARRVMDSSAHVMLAGRGAEEFAEMQGLQLVENDYFHTEARLQSLYRQQAELSTAPVPPDSAPLIKKFGTVGCVAMDREGNLSAGTSTGGMSNKRFGRIGDAPIIGAGTFADNATCAVSCTGHGEYFIRWVVAYDVSAMMAYGELSLQEAADRVIMQKLVEVGGSGGLIAVDAKGEVALPFNSDGMYRGYRKSTGEQSVAIFAEN